MALEDEGAKVTTTTTLKHAVLLAEHDGLAGAIVDQSLGDGDSTAFCGPASKTGHPIKLSLVESLLLALGDLKVLRHRTFMMS